MSLTPVLDFNDDRSGSLPGDLAAAGAMAARLPAIPLLHGLESATGGRGERFPVIRIASAGRAAAMGEALAVRGGRERWDVRHWARMSFEGGCLLAATDGPDGRPAGFLGWRRNAAVEIRGDGDFRYAYDVHVDYVYVTPSLRGQGAAATLARLPLEAARRDLAAAGRAWLAHPEFGRRQARIEVSVFGTAESDEGESFMENLRRRIDAAAGETLPAAAIEMSGFREVTAAF